MALSELDKSFQVIYIMKCYFQYLTMAEFDTDRFREAAARVNSDSVPGFQSNTLAVSWPERLAALKLLGKMAETGGFTEEAATLTRIHAEESKKPGDGIGNGAAGSLDKDTFGGAVRRVLNPEYKKLDETAAT